MWTMPEAPPPHVPDLDAFRNWKPDVQQRALQRLREAENNQWRPFFCPMMGTCEGKPHGEWTWSHARSDQYPPRWSDDWLTLLLSGGRGSGKTRTGSEITHRVSDRVPRIILIAATGPDLRETMIEGRSGLLATAPPGKRPEWEPSKKKLTWPNGCVAQGFSAEEPDRLRGPESAFIWADEPAHYDYVEEVWSNMQFGLRIPGFPPKIIATTTPLPTKWMKGLIASEDTITRRVSTYANMHNLAPAFQKAILEKYEGTRLGRQELHGELLQDVEGALWNWDMFQWIDAEDVPDMARIVVGVDPAGTANARSDETGIITVGIGVDKNLYVFHDLTGRYSPEQWASRANKEHDEMKADAIVPEKTYGQDMVRFTLENSGYSGARIIPVDSRRGKHIRAEPIVALYEKKRVFHVGKNGQLSDLEDELTTWVPGGREASPNRLDALVHAATELAKNILPAQVADPNKVLRHLRAV